jgi:hypothetical protein
MKKLWVLLIVTVLLTSTLGTTAFAAGSTSVSITNYTSIQQGRSYTYTITVKISGSADFIGSVKFSGIFSHAPIYLDFHTSDGGNGSKTISNKVTFKIPSSAALGSTGKITVTGQGDYVDSSYTPHEYSISRSLTAKVVAYVAPESKPSSSSTKKPAASTKPTPSPSPTPTPVPTVWDVAAQSVSAMQAGGAVSMDAMHSSKMPITLLSALKDKKGKLTVNLGGYSCVIDGAALEGIPASGTIDLAMTMSKDAALSAAAGGVDAYQLHFAYSGQLPGRFEYTFKAAENNAGDTLYLYYCYDQSGVLEGLQSAVVDSNGNVSFVIYHCSSYIVSGSTIEGAAGTLADAVGAERAAKDAQNKLTDLEAQLKSAQDGADQLDGQLKQQESQLTDAQEHVAILQAEMQSTLNVSPAALIAGGLAIVLLVVFFTMLFCKGGLFKRKLASIGSGANDDL